jgi:hypothetical protein
MSIFKYIPLVFILFFISNCNNVEEKTVKEVVIPEYITILFVTQPSCPSCDKLEKTMSLEKPKELIENYFKIKKLYLGEKFPETLLPLPNGTPTVYFLGSNDEPLVEPIVGEKTETQLLEYLNDALYEFNVTYGVKLEDIKAQKDAKENNETNLSKNTI